MLKFFFFQAEDGIRDIGVTGVQTCALPISGDILFSKAFKLLVAEGRKVGHSENAISEMVARLSNACIYVCEGQAADVGMTRSEEHTSELQSRQYLVCRLLLEEKKSKIRSEE